MKKYPSNKAGKLNYRKGLPSRFPMYNPGGYTNPDDRRVNKLSQSLLSNWDYNTQYDPYKSKTQPALGSNTAINGTNTNGTNSLGKKKPDKPDDKPNTNWLGLASAGIGALSSLTQKPEGNMRDTYGTSGYLSRVKESQEQSNAIESGVSSVFSAIPGWGQIAAVGVQGTGLLTDLIAPTDEYGMAETETQQWIRNIIDPKEAIIGATKGVNVFDYDTLKREKGKLIDDYSRKKTGEAQDAYAQIVKSQEGKYLEEGGYMRKYPDGGPKYGYLKGNPLSDWWYNTDKVQGTYKMATDLDPFLKNWLLDPETQRRLKSNLKNTYNSPDPKTLTKEAISRLYKLPMYSRELVKKAGINQNDIEYNNTLQGWKTPSSILGSPYFSGDPGELGVYMPDYHVSMLNDFNNPGTIIHEQTHATGPFQKTMENVIFNKYWDKKQKVDEKFVKQFGRYTYDDKYNKVYDSLDKVKEKYPGIYNEYKETDKYLDKDGMYPRIMDIRKTLNLKPGQKVDKSILNNSAIDLPVSDLRNYYEDDVII